jgi:NAD(P)-dependent dehydrogenase (short-subunit alcohol dehydrogenase family)
MAKCLSVEWVDFCRVNCISPGFIATDILDIHPQEWRDKWYDMIPAKRMAEAYELKGVSINLLDGRLFANLEWKGVCVLCLRCIKLYDWCEPCDRRRLHSSMKNH